MATLAQLPDVKTFLQIDLADTTFDALLTRLINAQSAFVESHCKRTFAVQSYTDYLMGTTRTRLVVEHFPLVSVDSITLDGDDTVMPDRIDQDSGMLYRQNGWRAHDEIEVNYTAGYEETPDDVQQAVIEMVALKYQQSIEESTGKSRQVQGSVQFEYAQETMPLGIAALLERYVVKGA